MPYLFLNATPKHFMFPSPPTFQAKHQLGYFFLWCDIRVVPLGYTIGAEIFSINTQHHCSYYKWQLYIARQSSHNKAVYVTIIRGNVNCSLHKVKTD